MLLLAAFLLAILVVFAALPIAIALACATLAGVIGCAGLASTCPRKLQDDCLFTSHVI